MCLSCGRLFISRERNCLSTLGDSILQCGRWAPPSTAPGTPKEPFRPGGASGTLRHFHDRNKIAMAAVCRVAIPHRRDEAPPLRIRLASVPEFLGGSHAQGTSTRQGSESGRERLLVYVRGGFIPLWINRSNVCTSALPISIPCLKLKKLYLKWCKSHRVCAYLAYTHQSF